MAACRKTVFGGSGDAVVVAVANFGDSSYQYENIEIPTHSVLIEMSGGRGGLYAFAYSESFIRTDTEI